LYFFLWRYDGDEKIFGCWNIDEEFAEKFWTTFVEKLLRNKGIYENLHFFLPNFGGRSKWKILNVKKLSWVQYILFLSTLRSLLSTEKTCRRSAKRHKQKPARKKLAGIFGKIFLFYMVVNVPVILHEMLLYCFRMLFMM